MGLDATVMGMNFDSLVHGVTTMITVRLGNDSFYGTGFYYHKYAEKPVKTEGTMKVVEITEIWLVTNRHVILGTDPESVPDELSFKFRRIINKSSFAWEEELK
jgi:hypothetical protein